MNVKRVTLVALSHFLTINLIAALLIANPSTRPHRQLAPANLKHYWYVPTSGELAPLDQLKSPISEPLYFEIV